MGGRVESLTHDCSVRLLDRNAPRCEVGKLVGASEGCDGSPLVFCGNFHLARDRVLRDTFHGPQLSSADDGRLNHVKSVPSIEATVRLQGSAQKFIADWCHVCPAFMWVGSVPPVEGFPRSPAWEDVLPFAGSLPPELRRFGRLKSPASPVGTDSLFKRLRIIGLE